MVAFHTPQQTSLLPRRKKELKADAKTWVIDEVKREEEAERMASEQQLDDEVWVPPF